MTRSKVMKRVTILIEDSKFSQLNLGELVSSAVNFTVETLDDKPAPAYKKKHRDANMSVEDCIMAHFTMHGMFTHENAKKWMTDKGFAASSASPAVSRLVSDGNVEVLKKGHYRFIKPAENKE